MKLSPKDPTLNKLAAISLVSGVLITGLFILSGSETRAQMNAEVAEKGYGYGGVFQIIGSVMNGFLASIILFVTLTIIMLIKDSKKNEKGKV